jgi:rubrerythrin
MVLPLCSGDGAPTYKLHTSWFRARIFMQPQGDMHIMEPINSVPNQSPSANLEIRANVLNTPHKRSQFLKGVLIAGTGIATAATLAPTVGLAGHLPTIAASDMDILNYALTLERLEMAFYDMAVAHVPFERPRVRDLAKTIQEDEHAHVAALTSAITSFGGTPVAPASGYKFGADTFKSQSAFLKLSYMLEDTGVHAYLGAARLIKSQEILLTVADTVTVEARHAGAIRYLYGLPVTLGAFDTPLTKDQVLSIAGPLIG